MTGNANLYAYFQKNFPADLDTQLLLTADGRSITYAKADAASAKPYRQVTAHTNGYLKILITGSPEQMSQRLIRGMSEAAQGYWQGRKGKNPNIVKRLLVASESKQITTSEVLALLVDLQAQLAKTDCAGILLVIDELGKFLEYEARHYGANDIYLLQALAEHACQGNQVNLLLFALLHQSFEQYAKGLGESLKNEWSKVQGRSEEVPFLESAEQTLRVVSAAFEQSLNKGEQKAIA